MLRRTVLVLTLMAACVVVAVVLAISIVELLDAVFE